MTENAPTVLDAQGGDLRSLPDREFLDLGTCVNRYGPPPAVETALRCIKPEHLLAHPYGDEERFTEAYAEFMGASPDRLIPGRGITEFIRVLAQLLPTEQVAVVTPDYTDTIRRFPVHLDPPSGTAETAQSRLERVELGMRTRPYVFLSNPNNPLGFYLHRDDLMEICRANPDSVLIVDEAYIEFLPDHAELSMTQSGLSNVVVLRSPNKFFGIAGTRTGALWTLNPDIFRRVAERKLNWTLSHVDAVLAIAALGETEWAEHTRSALLANALGLEEILGDRFPGLVRGVPVHYRFIATDDPIADHRFFLDHGVAVRALDGRQPGRVSGLRITAPTAAELANLKDSLAR
ncbi:aminotransferase class I/II-fold pyridoxal phosphate-dependent enzyme [Streptomyces sp. BG9H]|uniref:Aminotransferase class I/II-fold pyridoxal phosphate-dependent enzyme n=1 Tax=Streptomyces anatolicus TaxID=2675858 RepID=A0ABS6YJ41_9ACTN|nr:aminotransferase class I/II-fold pyridoxal phosphate-dependent enzyme [Streptomyces anatolicus]MBW5421429.1 aminotransferase class I/II-fold pyridoxal phosphate-dependent enzyme [Streptomyces anatolicus]